MPNAITIRPAKEGDLISLSKLLERLFNIEEDFESDHQKQIHALNLMLEKSESCCILVAENATHVIGMCTAQLLVSTSEGGPAAMIEDVIVHPQYQQAGIGKQLMGAITQWAREKGALRLQLLADRNNTQALEFYNNIDWQPTKLICLRKKL